MRIAGVILFVVAWLAHMKQQDYGPFQDIVEGTQVTGFKVRDDMSVHRVMAYKLWGAVKWLCIGALVVIAVASFK